MNSTATEVSRVEARHGSRGDGLTSVEAARRLGEVGPNEVVEHRDPGWRRFLTRFWGPLPWMLEATIVLTVALGKGVESLIITVLLVMNSVISFLQQARADDALALLRGRLAVTARVRRDARWRPVPARELVPGDVGPAPRRGHRPGRRRAPRRPPERRPVVPHRRVGTRRGDRGRRGVRRHRHHAR